MHKLSRPIQMKLYVDEDEREFIRKKAELAGAVRMTDYLRKVALDGYILNVDYSMFREINKSLQSIANSINQIAKRVNSTDTVYREDIALIKEQQEKIWQLQKSILSQLP